MPRLLKWIIVGVAAFLVVLAGLTAALWLVTRDTPSGALETDLSDVTVTTATTPPMRPEPPENVGDRLCWEEFGGNPQRSLARVDIDLGLPARQPLWNRVLDDYMEFPPSYCDGTLYVNTLDGATWAVNAQTGKVRWRHFIAGPKPSTPAIDGPRVIVASKDGTVTALDRENGKLVWRIETGSGVESSPVVVDGLVYFGAHDGRLFAVHSGTGRIKWAYNTRRKGQCQPVDLRTPCMRDHVRRFDLLPGQGLGSEDLEHVRQA